MCQDTPVRPIFFQRFYLFLSYFSNRSTISRGSVRNRKDPWLIQYFNKLKAIFLVNNLFFDAFIMIFWNGFVGPKAIFLNIFFIDAQSMLLVICRNPSNTDEIYWSTYSYEGMYRYFTAIFLRYPNNRLIKSCSTILNYLHKNHFLCQIR